MSATGRSVVINLLEVIGASMGIAYPDHYKRLKILQDVDLIVAECRDLLDRHGIRDDLARRRQGDAGGPAAAFARQTIEAQHSRNASKSSRALSRSLPSRVKPGLRLDPEMTFENSPKRYHAEKTCRRSDFRPRCQYGGAIGAAKGADFPAQIAVVLSNRADAAGLARAGAEAIPAEAIDHRQFGKDRERFDAAVQAALDRHRIDIVCLAGFMRLFTTPMVLRWSGRMINIHPALLPSFKGLHTHERALAAGVKIHGASVHFVVPEVDSGPIIAQAAGAGSR